MNSEVSTRPTLYTLDNLLTVRHLLIEGDDPGAKTLSKLENGVRTVVATGTHYEMDEKALALVQEWCQKEDFSWRNDDAPVWESLREIVALAKLMGHTSLHDAQRMFEPAVPLDHWQGCRDKRGDDYQYAYTGTMIEAWPKVTAKHGISMALSNTQEMAAQLAKIIEIRKGLGPERKFMLD
jgi:hypothetical protein